MTLIEIKPHRWGWKVFETPGVEPVFPEKSGEIQILDWSGNLERIIAFNEVHRKL